MSLDIPVHSPVEDLLLAVFNDYFDGKGVHVGTTYSEDNAPPMVMSREKRHAFGRTSQVDERFLRPAMVVVNTITAGVNADAEGSQLQEACRHALMSAWLDNKIYPGLASISRVETGTYPSLVADWDTSTGVVQYAALPQGWVRYEAIYRLLLRPPTQSTIINPFITPGQ